MIPGFRGLERLLSVILKITMEHLSSETSYELGRTKETLQSEQTLGFTPDYFTEPLDL